MSKPDWMKTAAQVEQEEYERKADEIRREREELLSQSDWRVTQALEKGISIPPEWKVYRESLRDITEQASFPYTVKWPTSPE